MHNQTFTAELPGGETSPKVPIEFVPADPPVENGPALVILPGGGYRQLAAHEGGGYANFFSKNGVACFVARYRLAPAGARHPAMLEDALAAIRAVRSRAGVLGIAADKIGIIGSSAGGHLAALALTAWRKCEGDVPLKPDFGILCYPVITASGEHSHAGCMSNLLGPGYTPAQAAEVSCEKRVSRDTPPCFIWHTRTDPVVPVENSLLFASALAQNGVPFELHVYAEGGHGLGLETGFSWGQECLRWMRDMKYL